MNSRSKRVYSILALANNNITNILLDESITSLMGIFTKDTSFFIHTKLIK